MVIPDNCRAKDPLLLVPFYVFRHFVLFCCGMSMYCMATYFCDVRGNNEKTIDNCNHVIDKGGTRQYNYYIITSYIMQLLHTSP